MDKQVNNKKKNKWLIFGVIILLLQVIASVVAIGEVYLLNMLPNALFVIVIGCFVFLCQMLYFPASDYAELMQEDGENG